MESKLDRRRRLSKELHSCLVLMKKNPGGTRDPEPGRSTNFDRSLPIIVLSKTIKHEPQKPLLSLTERRRASKQLKQDKLHQLFSFKFPPIFEDFKETAETPQLENLRIQPQLVETTPVQGKYCLPRKSFGPTYSRLPVRPSVKRSLEQESTDCSVKLELPRQSGAFTAMLQRLVGPQKSAADSLKSVKRVVIKQRVAGPRPLEPRDSLRTSIQTASKKGIKPISTIRPLGNKTYYI